MDTYLVRCLSAVIVVVILAQFALPKGTRWHIRIGISAGVLNVALLLAVLYRGYVQYDQPHGRLYPVHLILGGGFFLSLALTVLSGWRMHRGLRYLTYADHELIASHARCAQVSLFLLVTSLGVGVASFMQWI